MKKKQIAFFCIISFLIMAVTACGTKVFKFENITEVELISGSNGDVIGITEQEQIQSLIQSFAGNEFIKGESSANQSGWNYRLKFYQGDKVKTDIVVMSSGRINFKGYFYDVKNGTINTAYYDELLSHQGLRLGDYASDTLDQERSAIVMLQGNNEFVLCGPVVTSYSPTGKYSIVEDKLMLSVTTGEEYVFSIRNGKLVFESGEWLENWVELGAEFRFIVE